MMTTDAVLVNELGLAKSDANSHAPYFTGWKNMDAMMAALVGRPVDESMGYIGQIVQRIERTPTMVAYVNLPGFETGVIPLGACFEVGTERLYEAPTADVMAEMLRNGLKKLQATVEAYKAA